MKDANKIAIKKSKKAIKQKLETDLSEKLRTFISSLGHDVEEIGDELKKASKIIAKKLSKKIIDVKLAVSEKFESANSKTNKAVVKVKKELVKDAKQTKKIANATLTQVKKEIAPKVVAAKKEIEKVTSVVKKAAVNVEKQLATPKSVIKPTAVKASPAVSKASTTKLKTT
ncbi:MAG: hypothetical protein EAZ15_06565 [Sphingobacteriales bacterium]|nr:MAG: hypothetical protein EAZ15_06565 [Sphingobacteriales bacterium]